jgi:hypothetical protein
MSDTAHPAPHRHKVSRRVLALCIMAAPALWLVQTALGFGLWAYGCYPGDHPVTWRGGASAYTFVLIFDGIAVIAALAAGVMSYSVWRSVHDEVEGDHRHLISTGEGRTRFMAMWGMLFSGCFLAAILFATVTSAGVPPCD